MKIFEYERHSLGDKPKIQIEAIEDKVKFLVQVLLRLRKMYIEGVKERVDEIKVKAGVREQDLEYPTLSIPSNEMHVNPAVTIDSNRSANSKQLMADTDKALQEIRIVECNRMTREKLMKDSGKKSSNNEDSN